MLYQRFILPVIKRIDPEKAHHLGALVLAVLPGKSAHSIHNPVGGSVELFGKVFPNRFGLAAGFDKDGKYLNALSRRGFGHIEIGTVTGVAQPGNPRPRMFRLPEQRAIINRMGFNNDGAEALAERLRSFRTMNTSTIVGVNIGKTKDVELEDAIQDYVKSTLLLAPLADYLMINVSSPNTPGLRGLQELDSLRPLLGEILANAGATPVLVKIAPDLPNDQIMKIAELVKELGLAGISATNTTISKESIPVGTRHREEAGGLSGPMLHARSLEVLDLVRTVLDENFCVISVGGVDSRSDFIERLEHGATLVQGMTSFIYRGPFWARQIVG